ncbi:MAG: alpha/beta hydrolase [Clostridia bacterium]|nr:alpha/beta hydrolase [Clostridia bacterium]
MKFILITLAAIILFFVFFSIIPTFISFMAVFGRSSYREYSEELLANSYYAPFVGKISDARDRLLATECEHTECVSADGTVLSGRLFSPGRPNTVILMHGYRADPECSVSTPAGIFLDLGYAVLIPEQRAHGKSGGRFTTLGIREGDDVVAWRNLLEAKGHRVAAVYGISLGGTSVAFASDRLAGIPLIIDCPFISPEAQLKRMCAKMHLPSFLIIPPALVFGKLLAGEDLGKAVTGPLSNARAPILFLCGDRDTTVSYGDVEKMSSVCPGSVGLFTAVGAEHACSCLASGEQIKELAASLLSADSSVCGKMQTAESRPFR